MDEEDRRQRLDHVSDQISNTEINRMPTNINNNDYENVHKLIDENIVLVPDLSVSLKSLPQNAAQSTNIDYDLPDISFCKAVIHLVSLSVCSLVLSTPFSTREVFGDTGGFVVTLASLFLYLYALNTFLWSKYEICRSEELPSLSYSSFVHFVLKDGPLNLRSFTGYGALVTDTVFTLFLVCGCCYNFLMGAENIRIVYNLWAADSVDLQLVVIWILVPLLSLCWLVGRVKHLMLVSFVAYVLSMLCIAAVMCENIFYGISGNTAGSLAILTRMPFCLFGVFFMFHTLGSDDAGTDIVREMSSENRECRKLKRLFAGIPVLLAYAVFGFRCSLKYRTRVADMRENVSHNQPIVYQIALLANAFASLSQYPLLVCLIFSLTQSSVVGEYERQRSDLFVRDRLAKMLAMTVIVFLTIYHLPSVDVFLIFGNVFGVVIDSLLFPVFILTLVAWRIRENKKVGGHFDRNVIVIGFLALMLIVLGTISSALDLLRYCSRSSNTELFEYL